MTYLSGLLMAGMRKSSQILIFLNIQKALDAGIKFYLSDNGVVLTEGDERGFLSIEFFDRVEDAKTRKAVEGWKGSGRIVNEAAVLDTDVGIIDK
jgi:2'-phosphotransferase